MLTKPLKLGSANDIWYSADGKRVAVSSAQTSVWDLELKKRLWRGSPLPYLNYCAFSPDGARLAVKSTTGQIAVVDAARGKKIVDFRNKKDDEGCNLAFSPCGRYIIDGTWDGDLFVREAANGKVEFKQSYDQEMIHDVFCVDGGREWLIHHHPKYRNDNKVPPPPYLSRWTWPFGKQPTELIKLPKDLGQKATLSCDGRLLAFESNDDPKKPAVKVLSLGNGKTVGSVPLERGDWIRELSWSADGRYLGLVKDDRVIIVGTDKFEPVFDREETSCNDIAFSPTGDTIAIASKKAVVVPWNDIIPAAGETPKIEPVQKPAAIAAETLITSPEHQKAFKKVLDKLPAKSKVRELLAALAADDEDRREAAYDRATQLDRSKSSADARSPSWALTLLEAVVILEAGAIAEFPPPPAGVHWKDGYHTLLTTLWRSPHQNLWVLVEPVYEKQPHGTRRAALLALLAIFGTREAAELFAKCIRRFGWPPLYLRVWDELGKLFAHGDVLLPDIALAANKDQIGDLCNAITYALADGTLKLEQVAGRLDALAPVTVASTKKLIKQLSKYQTRKGIEWRFGDAYSDARYRLSSLLTLSGYLLDPKLPPLVREAAKFTDPVIGMSAAVAMLRQTGDVSKPALRRAAQSDETRASLYVSLAEMKRTDLFPKQFATWEAFAASAMVDWLKYPTELGREPDELQLGHTEWLDKRRKLAMFVWKFRNAKEPWLAGVSGPHELRGSPRPTHGSMTFSQFEEWDSATPQEHLKRCGATVEQICE